MPTSKLGQSLFEALTQQELIQLLDSLWATLPAELHNEVLTQLPSDTGQTVGHILSPPQPIYETEPDPVQRASVAKLAETWADAWQMWDSIINEASDEEGDYIAQEAHWEPPYFDQYAFAQDLEKVTKIMRPLVQSAVEHRFEPDMGFAEAISRAEDKIAAGMPEWIYLDEGFELETNLTYCLLMWEWLSFKETDEGPFAFAELVLEWERNTFNYAALDSNTVLDFFAELSEAEQKEIFEGLSQNKDVAPWKSPLSNPYDHWHILYLYYVEQFAPEQYLDKLRQTIPSQWYNGLPVIEEFLKAKDYQTSVQVIKETITSMTAAERIDKSWTIETSLIATTISDYYGDTDRQDVYRQLFEYYQQTATGLNQIDVVNILSVQLTAFDHRAEWEVMFKIFAETPLSEQVRQALFVSWRDNIIQQAKPSTWGWGWNRPEPRASWWLLWLIDSLVDEQKGPTWFQQQMAGWLTQLPSTEQDLGEDYGFLRLLTNDLSEIDDQEQKRYPRFYGVVIRPGELKSPDQVSRRMYLKQFAGDDLMNQVMGYWKAYLKNFVPRPDLAEKSVYTSHARWMTALQELAPTDYETLLEQWHVQHHRRRNLWKAMTEAGLI